MRTRTLNPGLWRAAFAVAAAVFMMPIRAALAVVRFLAARPYVGDAMPCRTCGQTIPLLGFWVCSCGWSFYGRYWTRCEYCGDLPGFIDCVSCASSNFNPLVLG